MRIDALHRRFLPDAGHFLLISRSQNPYANRSQRFEEGALAIREVRVHRILYFSVAARSCADRSLRLPQPRSEW
jgi:hypothetical protein